MARPRLALAALALALVASSGCAVGGIVDWMDLRGHRHRLEDTQRKYVRLLRWGEYDAASFFVSDDVREAFRHDIADFGAVRFTDYEILDTEINELQTEADILVSYRAYHTSYLVEYAWSERQKWHRDVASNAWTVKPDLEQLRGALAVMRPQ